MHNTVGFGPNYSSSTFSYLPHSTSLNLRYLPTPYGPKGAQDSLFIMLISLSTSRLLFKLEQFFHLVPSKCLINGMWVVSSTLNSFFYFLKVNVILGGKYLTCKSLFIHVKFPSCIHKYFSYGRLWAYSILEICAECVHRTCYCDFHIDLNSRRERVIWYMNLMHIITCIAFLFFESIAWRYFYTLLEIRPNALYLDFLLPLDFMLLNQGCVTAHKGSVVTAYMFPFVLFI